MGFAIKTCSMEDRATRSESVLIATLAWRSKAAEVFKAMGHGSKSRCAKEVGCSSGFMTQLLSGEIVASEFVGPISDWLRIPRPEPDSTEEDVKEAIDRYSALSPQNKRAAMAAFVAMIESYEQQEK